MDGMLEKAGSTTIDERERSRDASRDAGRLGDGEIDSASDYPSPLSPRSPPAGLSGLSARLKGVENEDDERDIPGAGGRSSDDYYDKYGRSSVNSDHSVASGVGARSRAGASEDQEKLRRDYEFRIATMQTQITSLQRDLGDAGDRERKLKEGEARVRQMEEELMILRRVSLCSLVYCVFLNRVLCYVQRAEEESMAMRALQGNSMNYGQFVSGKKSEKLSGPERTMMSSAFCATAVRGLRKSDSIDKGRSAT